MRALRIIAGNAKGGTSSTHDRKDCQILDSLGSTFVGARIVCMRLQYLARVCSNGPEPLVALLQATK
eukprot:11278735-Alexandrium_andersonii.AAC.1